jgi:hypothetical protein
MLYLKRTAFAVLFVPVVLIAACGGDTANSPNSPSSRRVTLTARVVHGPSVQSVASQQNITTSSSSEPFGSRRYWAISPDQARITIATMIFTSASGDVQQADLSNCVVSYVRATPSLSRLLDCPFTIAAGSYVSLSVGILNDFDVLIDDAANGLFTDPNTPSGIVTSRPSSGARFVHYRAHLSAGQGNLIGSGTYFTTPLVIDSASAPMITLVADMIHTLFLIDSAGIRIDTLRPAAPVELVPSATGAGKVEFYSSSGTALNVLMPGESDAESRSIRLFYANPPQPSYVFAPIVGPSQAFNMSPAKSPTFNGQRAGGYLGIDGSGVLCFALPKDNYSYAQYNVVRRMPIVSTIGASTVVTGQRMLNAPAPISGDTYASGCPTIVPLDSLTFTAYLVAR